MCFVRLQSMLLDLEVSEEDEITGQWEVIKSTTDPAKMITHLVLAVSVCL